MTTSSISQEEAKRKSSTKKWFTNKENKSDKNKKKATSYRTKRACKTVDDSLEKWHCNAAITVT